MPRARRRTLPGMAVAALFVGLGLLGTVLYLAPEIGAAALALLGVGIPLLLVLWVQPDYGLLAIILLTSSFVPADVIDLPLPVGGIELRDLALVGMLGILMIQGLIRNKLRIPWWAVSIPLLVFLALSLFSAVYALLYRGVESNWVFSELRAIIFWATFFVTAWSLADETRLRRTVNGLFFLADITATLIILQQFLGAGNRLLSAMSGTNWTVFQQSSAAGSFGTVRIVPPGHVLMNCMMVIAFCFMVVPHEHKDLRYKSLVQFAYLNVGLLLTYTRAQWIAAGIALTLVTWIVLPQYRARATRYLVILGALLMVAYSLFGPAAQKRLEKVPFVTALSDRFVSLLTPSKTLDSYSLQWRIFELEKGREALTEQPLLGVGLGNSYRDITLLHGEASGKWYRGLVAGQASRFTRFIHSSYLSIAVKMGLPAVVLFLWFAGTFLGRSWRLLRLPLTPYQRGLVLGVGTSFVGLLLWAIFHQLLVQTESTAAVGVLLGLVASIATAQPEPSTYLDLSRHYPHPTG